MVELRHMNTQPPFTISVRDLERQPGAARAVSETVTMEDIATQMIAVDGSTIRLEGRLESVHDGVLITGTVTAQASGECSRCLKSMEQQLHANIQELYFYPERAPETTDNGSFGDVWTNQIIDNRIDVGGLIRSELMLQLPFTPVCDDDCPGLCPQCGQNLDNEHEHDLDDKDSRWEKLKRFKF